MNPRVSRSSALASKATGYPDREDRRQARRRLHARRAPQRHHRHQRRVRADHRLRGGQVAALRVREVPGRRLAPRHADEVVGEAMAIGRTFQQALQKAARSLEIGRDWPRHARRPRRLPRPARCAAQAARDQRAHGAAPKLSEGVPVPPDDELREALLEVIRTPLADRLLYIVDALRVGATLEEIHESTADRPVVLRAARRDRRGGARARSVGGAAIAVDAAPARQGHGLLRRHDRAAHGTRPADRAQARARQPA